ncbi:MAG: metalloprotease TldD [Rhodospirillaceae bacterium]|nr:metalloprotease TldD [Rhodospirillaceae bacterium]
MTDLAATDDLFFNRTGMDRGRVQGLLDDALTGMDDGELFLEYRQSESLVLDDGQIKTASFDTAQGFGLRAIAGESTGYSHASDLSEAAIARAAETVKAVQRGHTGTMAADPQGTNRALYMDDNPLAQVEFQEKVAMLRAIDAYARAKDDRVRQVSASILGNWQAVQIVRSGGHRVADIRPLVRVNVSVVLEQDGRMETGSYGTGGRVTYEQFMDPANWQNVVDEAFRQAEVNLGSVPAPAGEVPVVLGPGWPGILLHEAIGHGLEGDFNRKKTSVFSGLMGERVASPGVTVVDDGTIKDRRGSLTIDDEGTPSENTVLIEDGILKGYMQDRTNARLMGVAPTGNGRRESYAHQPLPRMTNTVMLGGDKDPEEILKSVKKGIYAVSFGGGQVDITSGKFVFSCTEAYEIEDGKVGRALKGATLIGDGKDVLNHVTMVGNDMELDPGIGTCGKDGQGVPVGVGQPTLKIDQLTVGGTGG